MFHVEHYKINYKLPKLFHVEHQLKNIEKCPICENEKHLFWRKGIDHNVSQDSFIIVSCEGCGFRFTNPKPSEETIGNYYKSSNYISHSGTKKGMVNKIYHTVRKKAIKQKELLLSKTVKSETKNLVDIGCGNRRFFSVL